MDTKPLEAIGFTPGEARVYLALLQLGETTTGGIIEKSGITGSKVYELLDKLAAKGLVSYVTKEKTKFFQPVSPKRLLDYVNKKENEIEEQKERIKAMIPELEALQSEDVDAQSSQMFEGYEGIKTVFSLILESLKSSQEYYAFSLGEELADKKVMLFLENYHQKRIARKIKVKILAEKKEIIHFAALNKLKGIEIRYCVNAVPTGVFIFANYVATIKFSGNPTAFVIKSRQISNSYRKFFDGLWHKAGK